MKYALNFTINYARAWVCVCLCVFVCASHSAPWLCWLVNSVCLCLYDFQMRMRTFFLLWIVRYIKYLIIMAIPNNASFSDWLNTYPLRRHVSSHVSTHLSLLTCLHTPRNILSTNWNTLPLSITFLYISSVSLFSLSVSHHLRMRLNAAWNRVVTIDSNHSLTDSMFVCTPTTPPTWLLLYSPRYAQWVFNKFTWVLRL